MDCAKVGRLIFELRKEKKLTQRQVAEKLNISAKTVSKWECGAGCPDASLWEGLSALLGADLAKLLQGELKPNRPDAGNIGKCRFYVCPSCGNILVSTGEASVSCCGRRLRALVPASSAPEYEVTVKEIDIEYYVTVTHGMTKEHYIAFAACVLSDRVLLTRLYPEQNAELRLPVTMGGADLYLYCTEHGLRKHRLVPGRGV